MELPSKKVQLVAVKFQDTTKNRSYSTYLSPSDAKRAKIDIKFAQSILDRLIENSEFKQVSLHEVLKENHNETPVNEKSESGGSGNWSHQQILTLIEAYSQQLDNLRNGRRSVRDQWKRVSKEMARHGYNIPPNKCNIKFDTLKRRYRKILNNNQQPGNEKLHFEYFDILDAVFTKQQNAQITVVASSEHQDEEFENMNEHGNNDRSAKRRRFEIMEDFLEEERLRRKSREAYQKKELALLQKLVDCLSKK